MVSPIEATASCLKNYANFSGRATRSEFWWFQVFYFICFYGGHALGGILNTYSADITGNMIGGIVNLMLIVPMLSLQVRRLHDFGWSGRWVAGFYLSAASVFILIPILSNSATLAILLPAAAYLILVLIFMFAIFVQYFFRGSNAKGDKYGASLGAGMQTEPTAQPRFVPQEYVPPEYAPQGYVPQPYVSIG